MLSDTPQHVLFTTLLQLARQQQFVENVIRLGEGEDDIELANVAVVLIHLLNVAVDDLERDQLIVFGGGAGDEEERSVTAVHNFGV